MHIHTLKMSVTEQELNELAAALPSSRNSVQNLQVRLTVAGIVVKGDYAALMMKMAFETLWEVKGAGSIVEARLASMKVAGLPAPMLRPVLFRTLRDLLAREPSVRVVDESIRIDLSEHIAIRKLRLNIHLTAVQCGLGSLVIEAGQSAVGEPAA